MNSQSEERNSSRKASRERSRSRERERKGGNQGRDRKVRIKIPDLTEPLCSFKRFSYMQTQKMNPDTIQKGYDKYRKDWQQKQNQQFVIACKDDAWFNEKYNPELLELQEKEKRQLSAQNYQTFVERLQNGFYNGIQHRVNNVNVLGTVHEQDEEEEQYQNYCNFLNNQTIEVVVDNNINITNQPYFGFDPDLATLFIKGLPKQISRYDVKAAIQDIPGWKTVTMSDPMKRANFTRNCWIEFNNQDLMNKAFLQMNGLIIKDTTCQISKAFTKAKRIKILKNYPSTRLQTDIDTMSKLISKLDAKVGIESNVILNRKYETLQQFFDTLMIYLRKIHYFDYYSCTQFENQRLLTIKVGSVFLRIEADYEQLSNTQTVFKKIQQNAQKKIEEIVETPDYMVLLKDEMQKFIRQTEKATKDEERPIWKCQFCQKKFKTSEFLAKHLIARHDEIKLKKLHIVMEQLYLKDPFKITSYSNRDDSKMRKNFSGGFRRDRRKEPYRDYDEPEGPVTTKVTPKSMVNFLDI